MSARSGYAVSRKRSASLPDAVTRFALPPHVFACVAGSHVVFLDLKHDEYFALDLAAAHGLARLIPGWPTGRGSTPARDSVAREPSEDGGPQQPAELTRELVARGLLLQQPAVGGPADCAMVRTAESEFSEEFGVTPCTSIRDALAVLRASATASILLNCCWLKRIVARASRRRLTHCAAGTGENERLRQEVLLFAHLRPLFFSARNACLLESLALVEFLARRGLYPAWIFGVRTRPFAAHCWVQQDDIVCNDTVERVRRFTPIMAI